MEKRTINNCKNFAIYYDLFKKYESDYQIDKILARKALASIKEQAKNAKFDERLVLLGLLIDAVIGELKQVCIMEKHQKAMRMFSNC